MNIEENGSSDNREKNRLWAIKKECWHRLEKWSTESSAQGFPSVIRKKSLYAKLVWLSFTLASIGLCSYMLARTVRQYVEYEVTTKIRKEYRTEVQFPVVTICNTNPMITPTASDYIRDRVNQHYGLNITTSIELIDKLADNQVELSYLNWLLYETYLPTFNQSLRRSFGYDVQTMIQAALFNGQSINLTYEFEPHYDPANGNCFRFNAGSTVKDVLIDSGLELELFVGGLQQNNRSNFYLNYEYGFIFRFDDRQTIDLFKHGLAIGPGTSTRVELTRVESESLPMPYSSCVDSTSIDTLISREMSRLGLKYTRENCLDLVLVKIAMDKVGCYDARLPRILDATPCDTYESFASIEYLLYNINDYYDQCPYDCSEVKYEVSALSANMYPTYAHFNFKMRSTNSTRYEDLFQTNHVTYEMFKNSMTIVQIRMNDLKVTHLSEAPTMSMPDLLANLGGTLGLFIGVSILSFVEILELCFHFFLIIVNNFRK